MTNERLTVRELVARRGSSGVYSIAPSDSVEEAAREMRAQGVSGISVLEAGKLVGFLSEKDISHLVARGEDPAETAVKDAMATKLITVDIDTSLWDTAKDMLDNKLRHLPVLENGQPQTTISMRDVLGLLVEVLERRVQELRGEVDWIKYMQGD